MDENYVTGICQSMCPIKEAKFRQKENLLHRFEIKKGTESQRRPEYDPDKVVKSFSRSAAGANTTNPSNLRPYPVLVKTIEYLYREIFPLHEEKPLLVYNFMFDRFRAVRQDAVIQNLPAVNMIKILEPIVRFLMYFSYILVEENVQEFDSHINDSHLQECLKTLLVCYDESNNLHVNRWEIESAYLLFNLGNIKAMTRAFKLRLLHCDKCFNDSLELSLHWYLKNYKRVFELIPTLHPLLLCVINNYLPEVRKYSLCAMSHAYSSMNSSYPASHLKTLLLLENDAQVFDECTHFNIKVSDGKIRFLKKDFDVSAKTRQGFRLKWVDKALTQCDLVRMMLHGSIKLRCCSE